MTTQKPYTIHFVCRGNTYRSRLAAAYMATRVDGRFTVISSGINPELAAAQTVETSAYEVAKRHRLKHGIAAHKRQTTDASLATADVIVFLNKDVYDDAACRFTVDARKAIVWHVSDITAEERQQLIKAHGPEAVNTAAEHTFQHIVKRCDELQTYLTRTNWVDVYDAENRSTGLRLPLEWATDRGLWFRGVHVVATTPDGKFIVGKRVKNIVFFPGMLELSLGGAVDAGELPLQAARRETNEELGAELPVKAFTPLFVSKHSHYHPHYKKVTRVHSYNYHARLTSGLESLSPQPTEVAELRALSKRQVKTLLHKHRILHFGRLTLSYKLQEKAVAYSSIF